MRILMVALLVVLFAICQISAFASKKAVENSGHPFSPSAESYQTLIPLSLGLNDYYGQMGISLSGGAFFKVSHVHPIYAGFETGLDFLGSYRYGWYTSAADSSYVGLPLMGTVMYRFELPRVPDLHPYAALGLGPYLSLSTGRGVVLELAVRPGISWKLQPSLALHGEARFGVIGSGFFIAPTAGVTFLL